MVEVLFVQDIFLTEDSDVENLLLVLHPTVLQQWSSPREASVCSVWSSAWLCLGSWWGWLFGSSGTAAGCLLGKWDHQGLDPQGWAISCLPDPVIDCRESGNYVLSTAWTSSTGMLSTPAGFPLFNDCTAASMCSRAELHHGRAPKKNTSHGNEVLPQDTTHLIQRPCYQRGSLCQDPTGDRTTRRLPDHRKETQTAVVWSCLLFIRSGQNHLARHN